MIRAILSGPGYRVCESERASGHKHTNREDGFHRPRCCGRVGAITHRRAREGGLRNARAKGKRLGRPPKDLDKEAIAALRRKGLGWRAIAKQLGVGVGTLYRVAPDRSNIREEVFGTQQDTA